MNNPLEARMTQPLTIAPDLWAGKTVAVLGSGPSMNQALADSVRSLPRICARRSSRFAPDADMLVTLDGPADPAFWGEAKKFAGIVVVGHEYESEGDDHVRYANMAHERITLGEAHIVEVRNNGLAAIRLAASGGPAKILLLGFDQDLYEQRETENPGRIGLEQGLDALISELQVRGIEVERRTTETAERDAA